MQREAWKDEVLNSLSFIKRAEPSPFLFTRIEARLKEATPLTTIQIRLAMATFAILLVINLGAILQSQQEKTEALPSLSQIQAY